MSGEVDLMAALKASVEAARERRERRLSDVPMVGTLPPMPAINQEVIPADLDRFPSIVAVVDRDGDVWVRDGDVWSYASPADFSTEVLSAEDLEREYGVLRVAWVWL